MGWLWGASVPDPKPNPSNSNTDPLRDLDPSLRDFLQTESPSTHKPSPSSSSPQPPSEPAPTPTPDTPSSTSAPPLIYPDGRYADLWSSYRPLGAIEEEAKSDQEKLLNVLEGYKQRKGEIGRAALENCALEQGEVNECLRNGGWMKRMTMCREENRAFERCYLMQSRFLKALGYLSSPRPALIDEKIQMHADTLYHRMLAQEAAIAAAKASNAPIPTFPPIITPFSPSANSSSAILPPPQPSSSTTTSLHMTTSPCPSASPPPPSPPPPQPTHQPFPPLSTKPPELFMKEHLTPGARTAFQGRLEKLSPQERELEERAMAMEASQSEAVGRTVKSIMGESERKRRERREKGEAGFGDVVSSFFGR